MNKKKIISGLLVSVLLITQIPSYSRAALSDPDDLSKGIKLGLDLTTAIADNQDVTEGVKDVLKKEYDDWTWNYVVGNYEKLIFQNAEAELPDFKGKIDKVKEIIERIERISTQLGSGEYDEAAITAVDQVVSTVDHPVVSALWASVKLAYESHKLVQSTKAELHIETLYGVMENDRRLRGADRGDGLKTFEMKSDTVDYFYNKYLITDAGAREMMRSYVKARLGEDFPEQSYWQSFTNIMAIGSGVDYGKNFELEELEANKNTARRWIATLLNDLNNQAKVRYAEMRARQQRAEFDKFVERFSMFENDLPRIIKEFQNQKKLAVEIKEYPKFLTQSQTERQRIETEYLKLKKTDISAKKKMLDTAWNWQLKCLTYSSRAIYMGEKQLGSFLAEERKNWISFRDRINNDLKITPNEVIQEAVSISSSNTDESAQIGQSYYNAYLSSMIVPFEWEYDPDLLVSEYLEALNAGKVLKIWDKLNNLERNLISHYGLIWIKVKEYINSNRSTPEEWVYPKDHPPFLKCVSVRYTDPQKSISCGVGHANSIASQAHNNSRDLQIAKMENVKKQIIEIKSVFDELTEARRKEYYQLLKGVQNNIKDLPYNLEGSSSNWEPQELETLKFELKNLKLSSGAGYYVDPPNANLGQLQSLIQTSIKADNNLIQHIDSLVESYKQMVQDAEKKWKKAAADWNAFESSLDYTQKDYDQFTVLVSPGFSKKRNIDYYSNIARSDVSRYISEMKSLMSQYEQVANSKINDLELETIWLANLFGDWQKCIDSQIEKGILIQEPNGEIKLALQSGINGMAYTHTPYPHYLQQNELDNYQRNLISNEIKSLKIYKFMEKSLPNMYQKLNDIITMPNYTPAKEDNFIFPGSSTPIWKSNLEKAESILKTLTPDDQLYLSKLEELSKLMPITLRLGTKSEREREELIAKHTKKPLVDPVNPQVGELINIDESQLNFPLGKKYLGIRSKLKTLFEERVKFINKPREPFVPVDPRDKDLKSLLGEINSYIEEVKKATTQYNVEVHFNTLANYRLRYSYINKQNNEVVAALDNLEKTIMGELSKVPQKDDKTAEKEKIKDFYRSFKNAYESKSDFQVMSLISDDWESQDGTMISDLEDNLRNTFNMFNDIQYIVSGLIIEPYQESNKFNVSYDVEIIGKIYNNNITHKEKSSVNEIVIIESGKIKIFRTLNGRFWYVQ